MAVIVELFLPKIWARAIFQMTKTKIWARAIFQMTKNLAGPYFKQKIEAQTRNAPPKLKHAISTYNGIPEEIPGAEDFSRDIET